MRTIARRYDITAGTSFCPSVSDHVKKPLKIIRHLLGVGSMDTHILSTKISVGTTFLKGKVLKNLNVQIPFLSFCYLGIYPNYIFKWYTYNCTK